MIYRHRLYFLLVTALAVALRLYFAFRMQVLAGDTLVYGEIAKCLLNSHIYGMVKSTGCAPTLIRLPGYPAFLAFSFLLSGQDHYIGATLLQLVIDVLTCFTVADITRRVFSDVFPDNAARLAFLLTATCPFLISYVSTPLTECLEIFCIAAALDCAIVALDVVLDAGRRALGWWALCGIFCAGAILLRPDGGLLLGSLGLPVLVMAFRRPSRGRELVAGLLLLGVVTLSPLVPWAIRNWRVMHVFQPLVTMSATDPGEEVQHGAGRWIRTWLFDYTNTLDVGFNLPGDAINLADIPDRAYANSQQRAEVRALFDQYNSNGYEITHEMDRRFAALAEESIRLHPVRYYLVLPVARMLDMWFRPRTEMLPLDAHFWRIRQDPRSSLFSVALGLLNLAYVAAAVLAVWRLRGRIRYLSLLVTFPVVRSLFLASIGASEDRYTMECYPFVLVLASCFLCWWWEQRRATAPQKSVA